VCVRLCCKWLDMLWLAYQGHCVRGIELSRLAIEQFFDERGLSPHVRQGPGGIHYRAGPWELVAGDAFAIPADLLADCAGVYDRIGRASSRQRGSVPGAAGSRKQ